MSLVKLITVATAALFLLVVSAVLRYSELYVMSAAVMSVPVVSYILGRTAVRGLECLREAPEYAREGEPIPVRLRLHGKSSLLGPIEIDDLLPEWIERGKEEGTFAEESQDRTVVTYTAIARKRGQYTLGPLRLRVSDPLGFFQFNCDYPLTSRLVILPRALHMPELHMRPAGSFGESQFEGTGAKGSGTDFHGVREYQSGDELRRVHWPSTARHGRLDVIEFEHTRAQDAVIAIELRQGSEVGISPYTSLDYAARIAARLGEETLMLGSSARILCGGLRGPATVPGRGLDHLHVLLDALATVQADQTESLSDVLLRELDCIEPNSVVTCLSSSIDEGLLACTQPLVSREVKVQVILVNVAGELTQHTEQLATQLVAEGASVAVVDCSAEATEGHVSYNYAA